MGFQPRNMLIKVLLSLLNLIKIKILVSFKRCQSRKNDYIDPDHHQVENNISFPAATTTSSPWFVPLLAHGTAESVKNQLSVVRYMDFLKIKTGQAEARFEDDANHICIVCMNNMEGNQGVRELCNCSHAFHKECLDAWIDQGQLTCPLCRSKLLPNCSTCSKDDHHYPENSRDFRGDPWRAERMFYLFGEDYFFSSYHNLS